MPTDPAGLTERANYERIAAAIRYLHANAGEQPSLSELARHVGISEFHLQRTFTAWAGVSPKQFLQFMTRENARARLREHPVLDSALACGLSGAGRLHDLLIRVDAVTPGEVRSGGAGLTLSWGWHPTPFGDCLIATTPRGVCALSLHDGDHEQADALDQLRVDWPGATLVHDPASTAMTCQAMFAPATRTGATAAPLQVLLKGSAFQLKVWEALLRIPPGKLSSYQQVAAGIDQPRAARAVASAIAANNIALLIPCHRVIRGTGVLSEYRWGGVRKAAILGHEASAAAQM